MCWTSSHVFYEIVFLISYRGRSNTKYSVFKASEDLHLTQHKVNTIIKMIMNTLNCAYLFIFHLLVQVDGRTEEK